MKCTFQTSSEGNKELQASHRGDAVGVTSFKFMAHSAVSDIVMMYCFR